jgi:hypothetical protein
LTASSASYLIDCQFYLALNKLLDLLGAFNPQKVIMPMTLMQKYDWTGIEAKLVYSLPEYTRIEDENASGLAMLNRIVKINDNFIKSIDWTLITIEYQVKSAILIFIYF